MDLRAFVDAMLGTMGAQIPQILGAIAIFAFASATACGVCRTESTTSKPLRSGLPPRRENPKLWIYTEARPRALPFSFPPLTFASP